MAIEFSEPAVVYFAKAFGDKAYIEIKALKSVGTVSVSGISFLEEYDAAIAAAKEAGYVEALRDSAESIKDAADILEANHNAG